MKTLYLDCSMGAAGDMLAAALLELFDDPRAMLDRLNAVGVPGVRYEAEPALKCGITGTRVRVTVDGEEEGEHHNEHHHDHHDEHEHHHGHHRHSGVADIEHVVRSHLDLPEAVKDDVLAVFGMIAEAESRVHGVPVPEIHFHEVGTMDAVADIAAVCLMMRELAPDKVAASPVHVGSGQVKCAHGVLPVPAPATAEILRGVPVYGGAVEGELCTPTGAALLKHFVSDFGEMPLMRTQAVGYGMGQKDFAAANCVRAMLGESDDLTDRVIELACNIDDMTAEAIGYAAGKLLDDGALDVFCTPVYMKKGRPGTLIEALCRPEDKEKLVRAFFKYTTTLGVRETAARRYVLDRETREVTTAAGTIRKKVASGYGVKREKYEYDDLARLADERGVGLQDVLPAIEE